ncbi:MAG: PAS domain S-box protein [Rhizobiales bacterium]|nr:PAS domain S-box protein [Hyphomicrobiales bacterium]
MRYRMVFRAFERWRTRGNWGFGFAVVAFLLAFGIRFGLNDWLPPAAVPFLFFVLAVIVTTFFSGLWPGVFCAALSGLAVWYFFLTPPHSFAFSLQNVLNLGAYTLVVTLAILPIHFLETAVKRQRSAEASKAVLARQHEALFEADPNGILLVDRSGRINMLNAQGAKLFGYDREELMGQPVDTLVPVRFRGHHAALRAEFAAQPSMRAMGAGRDLYGLRKDGTEFPIEIGLNPFASEGAQMVQAVIVDITERKRAEERLRLALAEAERERARAEVFAQQRQTMFTELQHRVANNLQLVAGMLNLERTHVADPRAKDALTTSIMRLTLISKLHRKLHDPDGFQVDFSAFLKELCDDILTAWGAPNVKCSVNSVHVTLTADKAIPIALVATELISNALEHAFDGRPQGTINVGLGRDGDGAIRLSVTDDGTGLPDGFDPANSKSLGLRIIQGLTSQLGGRFEAVNGKGTTFFLIIPDTVPASLGEQPPTVIASLN